MRKRREATKTVSASRQQLLEAEKKLPEFEAKLSDTARAAVASRFEGYSERNAMLIIIQRPDATEVHSYKEWQKLGRQVRKGETGIRINAPVKGRDDDGNREVRGFWAATVFDIAQTDPVEVPVGVS